jgi:predicted DNA binding CopG/RHH family protein
MGKSKERLKPIPEFSSEAEERAFWETHDSVDYVDWSKARRVTFPNLKPSSETISLRLPAPLLSDLKALANKRDVPYQSLLKLFVAERVAAEWQATDSRGSLANRPLEPTSRPRKKTKPARAARG